MSMSNLICTCMQCIHTVSVSSILFEKQNHQQAPASLFAAAESCLTGSHTLLKPKFNQLLIRNWNTQNRG